MTQRLWPADAVAGAPRYSGRGLRQLQSPFLGGATGARPFGALSGVRPGTSPTTVTASATTWRCGLHAGVLDVQPAVEAGPYTYSIDEAVTGAVNAADASNARVDLIYVQLTDAAEGNTSQGTPPSVAVKYLAGTPAAVPVASSLPARSLALAQINIPKQGGGSPSVVWVARGVPASGGVIEYQTRAQMEADVVPLGNLGRVVQTGSIYEYSGATPFWGHFGGKPDSGAVTFDTSTGVIYAQRPGEAVFQVIRQAGRCYLDGSATASIPSGQAITWDANRTYTLGTIVEPTLRPKQQISGPARLGDLYGNVVITTGGVILFATPASFSKPSGAIVIAMPLSWPDPRF